ncbi:MAG: putative polymerase sigma factor [Bryobacterales bacterium]|nr:putative polymerase sigma factor [Bryobacterales bacterium]
MSGVPDNTAAIDVLYSSFYGDLRRLAHRRLLRNESITLLNTTALVHESYLKFLTAGRLGPTDRSQFLAYAAHVMRSVIVDFVRQRHAERRGGDQTHVDLDTAIEESGCDRAGRQGFSAENPEDEIIRVNQALDELAKADGRMVKVVEMRYFGGLDTEEIAASLGVTERTVRRDWEKARLLLSVALR